jgi:enoyl-CoA hydratase/carnithine racemase
MIETDHDGDVLTIRLARPERRNALTPSALDDLRAAVAAADAPVVYLTGAGSAFCAGADLDAVADLGDQEQARAFARRGQRVATTIEAADSAVVAGIDGPARGGGVELALACDVRVATPAASFAEPGVTFGLFGAWGGTVRLPDVVGTGAAMDLALSGRVIDAAEAKQVGLVSRVVDDPRDVAREIAANDSAALEAVKRLLRDDDGERQTRERREAAAFADLVADRADEIRRRRDGEE